MIDEQTMEYIDVLEYIEDLDEQSNRECALDE